jgi:hypothetical protein
MIAEAAKSMPALDFLSKKRVRSRRPTCCSWRVAVAELIQHQKVIDYTATIQWLPHSISTFFGLLRAIHAATLHHTAKRRLDHIQQPTVRARTHTQRIRSLYRP